MHVQEQIIFRVPRPLHRTGGKITTTSPALSSSLKRAVEPHLETAGRQQLTGNQKNNHIAQSVPGRARQLERRGQGTHRKLVRKSPCQKQSRSRGRRPGGEAQLAFLSAKEKEKTANSGEGSGPPKGKSDHL